jgi:hypothetical protein
MLPWAKLHTARCVHIPPAGARHPKYIVSEVVWLISQHHNTQFAMEITRWTLKCFWPEKSDKVTSHFSKVISDWHREKNVYFTVFSHIFEQLTWTCLKPICQTSIYPIWTKSMSKWPQRHIEFGYDPIKTWQPLKKTLICGRKLRRSVWHVMGCWNCKCTASSWS